MHRTTIHGNRLERMIGIAAASSVVNQKNLPASIQRFARWGVPVAVADQVRMAKRYMAGPDEARASALHAFARDPLVGTIWCARGGYGTTRLFPLLEKMGTAKALAKNPKLLIGYSDVTGLHLYFYQKLGLPSLHAVMPGTARFATLPSRVDKLLRATLAGELELGKKSHTASWAAKKLIAPRRDSEGVILGGNLTLLVNMVGTPWQPDLNGKILFLEDCAERPYKVDRMLTLLANAGMLKGLRGVLLGDFETDVVYEEKTERKYWREIFLERFEPLGIPVLENLPVGHGAKNEPLPLGVRAVITKSGKLLLLEQPVTA
ncbi:MAG: S66 peptidase family protein [Bdellovibrionota bacterium]